MRRRCRTLSDPNYGGRGISVCPEWEDFQIFHAWALARGYADTLSIERVDTNGNYEPGNCKWATDKEQGRNRRYVRRRADGVPWADVAEANGIRVQTLNNRIARGWSPEIAATRPLSRKA